MTKKIGSSFLSLLMLMILTSCVDKQPDYFKHTIESMVIDIQDNMTEEVFCRIWSENYNETVGAIEGYISCSEHYNYFVNLNIPKSSDNQYEIYYTEKDDDLKKWLTPYYYKHNSVEYLIGITKGPKYFVKMSDDNYINK